MSTSESVKKEKTTFTLEEWQNSELSRKQPRIILKRIKVKDKNKTKKIKKGQIIPDNQKTTNKTIGDLKNKKKEDTFHFDQVKIKTEPVKIKIEKEDQELPPVIKSEKEIKENSKRVFATEKNLKGLLNDLFTENEEIATSSENSKNCNQIGFDDKDTLKTVNIENDDDDDLPSIVDITDEYQSALREKEKSILTLTIDDEDEDDEKELAKIKKEATSTITSEKGKSSKSKEKIKNQRKRTENEKKVLKILLCLDPNCQKEFELPSKLNKHVLSQHPKIVKPIQCTKENCKKIFISKGFLQNHITKVHAKVPQKSIFKCRFCTKVFYSKVNYDAHKKSVHMKDWKTCPVCKKIVKNLDSHNKIIHLKDKNTMEECPLCDKMIKSLSMSSHLKTHAKEPKIVCLKCGKLVLRVNMSSHQLEHEKKIKLKCRFPGCSSTFPNKIDLEDHIYEEHEEMLKFRCKKCPSKFLKENDLKRHIAQNHEDTDDRQSHSPPRLPQIKYRECHICKELIETDNFQSHISKEHLKSLEAETETKMTEAEKLKETQIQFPKKCSNKICYKPPSYKNTEKPKYVYKPSYNYAPPPNPKPKPKVKKPKKMPEVRLNCPICNAWFDNFDSMSSHRRNAHLEKKGFKKCDICRQFIKNKKYDKHMKNNHGNIIAAGSGRSNQGNNQWVEPWARAPQPQSQFQPQFQEPIPQQQQPFQFQPFQAQPQHHQPGNPWIVQPQPPPPPSINPWVVAANQAFFPPFGQ